MKTYAFDWVDAFTTVPFGGNPCVVVHGAHGLSIDDRQALVRETSLSECAYLMASDKADFGARYYLADKEILMAGHPTVATVVSLVDRGLVTLENGCAAFTLEVGAGVMPIEVELSKDGMLVTMTQMTPVFGDTFLAADIARIYGLGPDDIIGIPQIVSTGTPFCIAVLKDKAALRRVKLSADLWHEMNPPGTNRSGMSEPFFATFDVETDAGGTYSRLLLPAPMPPEDPFTGSATGCMAAYLWFHGLIDSPVFIAEQGHWMGRPGVAKVEVLGPRKAPTGVRVSGSGRILMRGELQL